jgi:transmembrane sensor
MNPSPQSPDPASEEEAALWAARIEGSSLDASDRAELDAWLAGNPARRELLSRYREFSEDLGQLLPELVATGAVAMPRLDKTPRRRGWSPAWVIASALAAVAVAAGALWMGRSSGPVETLATASAQRRSFTLADGSRVDLNGNTRVLIENGRSERRLRLEDGEAFFVVSKDKSRPFIVDTPAGSVRVTGTIFNVRTEAASELEVTVVEGEVQVRPGPANAAQSPEPVRLEAGERLSEQPTGVWVAALSKEEVDDVVAWRHGKMVFERVPLPEALARFAHYFGKTITVTPGAATLNLSGQTSLDNLDDFFVFLEGELPDLHVTRAPDGGARVSLRTER